MDLFRRSIKIIRERGLFAFLGKVSMFILNKIKFNCFKIWVRVNPQRAIVQLKNFNSTNPEEIFNFSWNFYSELIRPMQIKEEFLELLKIFQKQNPKYILEIGTANGGSLFCFCKLAQDNATIISIDLPGGKFGGGYPEWKVPIYKAFAKKNQKLYLLRKDSHSQETLEEVKKILNGSQLDFLFIDGDHTYEGVKKDFEMYSPLVEKGGAIIFHDILFVPEGDVGGVLKFWNEIKNYFHCKELVKNRSQRDRGIGIIYK
jgi:predicted O-methyltransferase YrrM